MRDPIHPGETLRDDLDALGMSAAELARRIVQNPVRLDRHTEPQPDLSVARRRKGFYAAPGTRCKPSRR